MNNTRVGLDTGRIMYNKEGKAVYVKFISYNKAVLWKTRELSVAQWKIDANIDQLYLIVFIDRTAKKLYRITKDKFLKVATKKTMHQEEQYYFPIEALEVRDYID